MTDGKPRMERVDLTQLMKDGVLMAANERFFWPLGLALTWSFESGPGTATNLHVTQWAFPDGHRESIGVEEDDITRGRRKAFAGWMTDRLADMPEAEQQRALDVWNMAALAPTPLPDAEP